MWKEKDESEENDLFSYLGNQVDGFTKDMAQWKKLI